LKCIKKNIRNSKFNFNTFLYELNVSKILVNLYTYRLYNIIQYLIWLNSNNISYQFDTSSIKNKSIYLIEFKVKIKEKYHVQRIKVTRLFVSSMSSITIK